MKTLDKVLSIVGGFIGAFIIAMVVIFCVRGETPDTLITCVLGGGVAEVILTAIITVTKIKNNKGDDE